MRKALVMLIAALLAAPALAQERGGRGVAGQRESLAPRERAERETFRRERMERRESRREHRFTREEREKLRQDILDANRDMRRRR